MFRFARIVGTNWLSVFTLPVCRLPVFPYQLDSEARLQLGCYDSHHEQGHRLEVMHEDCFVRVHIVVMG